MRSNKTNNDFEDYYNECQNQIYNRPNETYEREDASLSVQAFINNFSFPTSLEELRDYINEGVYDLEVLLGNEETSWTVPKWTKPGDIVFFMHARTAIQKISALSTELEKEKDKMSGNEYGIMSSWLMRARALYSVYGGKIFAIGRVKGKAAIMDSPNDKDDISHWKSKLYADIDSIILLENPVDLSEFKGFITLCQGGAITPVLGKDFEELRSLIGLRNYLPRYVRESISIPIPLRKINRHNWIKVAGEYRMSFFLEIQFRTFYVDYLLPMLGDRKRIYRECRCCKSTNPDSYVDNIILFNGKYLPVEVKLNINTDPHLKTQVNKYCNVDECYLKPKDVEYIDYKSMYESNVLIIDTNNIYLYDAKKDDITTLYDLSRLKNTEDIMTIRHQITDRLKLS